MRGEEVILFLGVAALSLAIIVSVVAPILRQRRAPAARPPRVAAPGAPGSASPQDRTALLAEPPACAACLGRWPRGFRYCPLDGSRLDDGDAPSGSGPIPRSPGQSSGN